MHSIAGCGPTCATARISAGGKPIEMGPVATMCGPNITPDDIGAAYSDGELARLITPRHEEGRALRALHAVQDISWLPDADVVRSSRTCAPSRPCDRPNGATVIGTLGKVLDRQDKFVLDVARRIDHAKVETPPAARAAPPPTARYIARLCIGCHGEHLSGGPLPGAPSSFAIPLNLTPDATGLKGGRSRTSTS